MSRVSKMPEQRKQEIIEGALQLFSEKGYENTTIQDIAEKLNIAQGLCYRYFKSKQEIFASAANYYAEKCIENMNIPIDQHLNAIIKFNIVIERLLRFAINHSEFEASYQKESAMRTDQIVRVGNQITKYMVPIVKQGIDENVFSCLEVESTVCFLTFGIIHMIHQEMPNQNTKEYILSYRDTIRELCTRVLCAEKASGIGDGWELIG